MQDSQSPALVHSVKQTQEMLGGIGRSSVYKLIGEGKLKRVKILNRTGITDESIRAYVDQLQAEDESDND